MDTPTPAVVLSRRVLPVPSKEPASEAEWEFVNDTPRPDPPPHTAPDPPQQELREILNSFGERIAWRGWLKWIALSAILALIIILLIRAIIYGDEPEGTVPPATARADTTKAGTSSLFTAAEIT